MTWSIPIWFDLWLIGMAGGLSTVAFFLGILNGDKDKSLFKFATYLGFPMVMLSVLFLISDLGNPLRFWHFITRFNVDSPMSLGTWFIISWSAVSVLMIFAWQIEKRRNRAIKAVNALGWISFVLSFLLMAYGAVTPAVSGRPLWTSTFLLPALLVISDISMGLAILIMVGAGFRLGKNNPEKPNKLDEWLLSPARAMLPAATTQKLAAANVYVIILSAVALAGQLLGVFLSNLPHAKDQLSGMTMSWLGIAFWLGIIGLALGLPLFLYFPSLKKDINETRVRKTVLIASICVVAGGFVLRAVIITAGQL
ncbi:MAG: polysulfide reductase NrfD [Dehalococcoidales bacterium]|nr:polysulfide reductase NrfD [Dehalococcoidales bacterium]